MTDLGPFLLVVLTTLFISPDLKPYEDIDYDGWVNRLEERMGTDPTKPDTDGDGILDALDPLPLLNEGTPQVNFVRGEKRLDTGPRPRCFIWANVVLQRHRGDPQRAQEILDQLDSWGIGPSFGLSHSGPNGECTSWKAEIMQRRRREGKPTDGWMCIHARNVFEELLHLESGRYTPDNPAVREAFAQRVAAAAAAWPVDYLSPIDENYWFPVDYDWDTFCGYLVGKGYLPGDFGAETWDQVPRPGLRFPPPDAPEERRLRKECQYWAEQVQLDYYAHMADTVRQVRPDLKLNLGIFSPWCLNFGFYTCLPLSTFHQIRNADQMEWDLYDWVYTGDWVRDRDFAAVEAGNQFLTDVVRLPVQITFSPKFSEEGRDEGYYRLFIFSDLLLTDNITGLTFFYYGVPTPDGQRLTIDHPRMRWCGQAVDRARAVYPVVHSMPEKHRILLIVDDPVNMSEGSKYDAHGVERERQEFYERIRYAKQWYFRSYRRVAEAGYDARFCIPRMVPGLDLDAYDVIILDADYIDDFPLARLGQWAAQGKHKLFYRHNAGLADELKLKRDGFPLADVPGVEETPRDAQELAALLAKTLRDPLHRTLSFAPSTRINVRGNDVGERVVVLANFGREPQPFRFELLSRHERVQALFRTTSDLSLITIADTTEVSGVLAPREFEVLHFRPPR